MMTLRYVKADGKKYIRIRYMMRENYEGKRKHNDSLHGMPESKRRLLLKERIASFVPYSCRSSNISSCVSTFLLMNASKRLEKSNERTQIYNAKGIEKPKRHYKKWKKKKKNSH
jgi:hypothetical protein